MNLVAIVGRTTKDIILKETQAGKLQTSFTVAINDNKNHPVFALCMAYGKNAELMEQYVGKGSVIGVEGKLQGFKGENGSVMFIYVNKIQFITLKNDGFNEETDGASDNIPF